MKYQMRPEKNTKSGPFGRTGSLLTVLLAIAFVAMSSLSYGQSPEIRKALRLIDIEQPSKGIAALEQIASSGSSSSNQYYLGLGYLRTGNKDKALAAFEKGISINEKDGLNYAGKGQVKLLEKNATEAKANFDKALAVSKSKDANVLRAVGEGYLADTKYVLDAISILNKAKTLNAADPEIHLVLGDAFLLQNNGGESVSSYERAASADKKNGKPNYKVARVYKRSKNAEMVLENLNKSIAADPEYAPAYKELAETYYVRKEPAKAVEAAEKYGSITENQEQARYSIAFYYIMNKQFDKANEIFKDVVNQPDPPAVALRFYGRSLMLSDQDKSAEAIPVFQRYFQKAKPEDIEASDYAFLGKAFLKQSDAVKQTDKIKKREFDSLATESFAQSLAIDSAQTEILQLQGDTYYALAKYDKAIEAYKQLTSLRKEPLSQDLWSIGRAYYFNGQYPQADTAFTKLSEKQPTVTHGYFWAARARANIDSTMSTGYAKPMYDKFLEIALQNPDKYRKDIIEAYQYEGAYYIHKEENVNMAKTYYEKILALDPNNQEALTFIKTINAPAQQKGSKGGPNPEKK
jgi:tetratricopeptide (TPR) repeat protein